MNIEEPSPDDEYIEIAGLFFWNYALFTTCPIRNDKSDFLKLGYGFNRYSSGWLIRFDALYLMYYPENLRYLSIRDDKFVHDSPS